jgi:hypothetical protein
MNRRENNRFTVTTEDIKGGLIFADHVKILNISLSGIALHADKGLKIGKEYTVRLQVKDKVVPIKGIVVWCRLSQSRKAANGDVIPIYTIGFQFNDAPAGDVEEIIDFVKAMQNPALNEPAQLFDNPSIPDMKTEDDGVFHAFNQALKE